MLLEGDVIYGFWVILMYLLVTITRFFSSTFCPRLSWLLYLCPLFFPLNYVLYHFFVFLFTYCAKGHGVRCCQRFVFSFIALSYGLTLSPGFLLCSTLMSFKTKFDVC